VARARSTSWELVFVDELSDGWLAVTDPASRSGFAMSFDPDVFPVAWLWGVYGGWRGCMRSRSKRGQRIRRGSTRSLPWGGPDPRARPSHRDGGRFIAFDGVGR
jgi:hypothetical protein